MNEICLILDGEKKGGGGLYLLVSLKFYSKYQKWRMDEVLMLLVHWLSFDSTSDMNLTKSKWEIMSLAHFYIIG